VVPSAKSLEQWLRWSSAINRFPRRGAHTLDKHSAKKKAPHGARLFEMVRGSYLLVELPPVALFGDVAGRSDDDLPEPLVPEPVVVSSFFC
jgi:hypothetical protein